MLFRSAGPASGPYVVGLFQPQPPPGAPVPPVPKGRGAPDSTKKKARATRVVVSKRLWDMIKTDEVTERFDALMKVLAQKYPDNKKEWHKTPEWKADVKTLSNKMKKRGNQDGVNYPKNLEYRVGRYFKTQRLDDSSKEAADVEGDYDSSCFIDDRHDDRQMRGDTRNTDCQKPSDSSQPHATVIVVNMGATPPPRLPRRIFRLEIGRASCRERV